MPVEISGNLQNLLANHLARRLLNVASMTISALTVTEKAPARMRYAAVLRCLGQTLEGMTLKAVEVRTHRDDFIVQAWKRGTSMMMDMEKHYTPDEVRRLDQAGRARRKPFSGPPDLLSISQILRMAGNYIDLARGRLMRVSWQDQSDKIQSITMQWEAFQPDRAPSESQLINVEELCIHIYKQRKKITLATERQAHRPFVSVNRPS